ncbi:MAG TPA: TIM barrel protein [Pirellulaceae bacterium]|nr:TIM barrel protein [Pirellulaceae bacterium]
MTRTLDRREFLAGLAAAGGGAFAASVLQTNCSAALQAGGQASFGFGLVTYMWGAEWDLPTLLKNCRETKVLGLELRTTHKHKVEPDLDPKGREEVRNRFAESGVTLVGLGSNERFDHPDPAALKKAVEATKEFIRLSHDIGGSGVKVKPDSFHKEVPQEKTIEQIGKTLNELGEYAAGFGQQVRLEVHGQCAELPTIKAIMDIATDENVAVCWNSNPTDLKGDGLEANYRLVAKRFGQTVHVHELESKDYPYAKLFELLVKDNYEGWLLLEAASKQEDYVAALAEQKKLFDRLLKGAMG